MWAQKFHFCQKQLDLMAAGKVTASSLAEDTLQPVKNINSSHRSSLSLICFLCPWRECKQGKSNRLRRHFLGISYLVQQSCFFKFLYLLSFSSHSLIFLSLRVYILIVLLLFFFLIFQPSLPFVSLIFLINAFHSIFH